MITKQFRDDARYVDERKNFIDTNFPIVIHHAKSRHTMYNLHWHDLIEISYLPQGKCVFQSGPRLIELSSNQAIVINSGEMHTGAVSNNSADGYYSIVFDPKILLSTSQDPCEVKFIKPLVRGKITLPQLILGHSEWETDVLFQISEIIRLYFLHSLGYEIALKSSLYRILYQIVNNKKLGSAGKQLIHKFDDRPELIKKAIQYIQNNYDRKLTEQELCDVVQMSRYHFSRLFKSLTGQSPIRYINQYRIDKSEILLKTTKQKVLEIAIQVGFDNIGHFIKTFKELKKCTPSELRRYASSVEKDRNMN